MKKLEQKIPLRIRFLSLFYPIINYNKKYGKDCETNNLAKGEIERLNLKLSYTRIGEKVNRQMWDENGMEYNTIWVHLGKNYFKQISKTVEPRNC